MKSIPPRAGFVFGSSKTGASRQCANLVPDTESESTEEQMIYTRRLLWPL